MIDLLDDSGIKNGEKRDNNMMKRSNSNSRSQTGGKRYSNPVNFAVIGLLFALCGDTLPSHPFAAAQNIAGKFAARTTLEQAGSSAVKKKKRAFWKQATDEDSSNTDGESTTSWKWELFLAESRMIMISIISSFACAVLSWIWYSRLGRGKDVAGEEGGELLQYVVCVNVLAPSPLWFAVFCCLYFHCISYFTS